MGYVFQLAQTAHNRIHCYYYGNVWRWSPVLPSPGIMAYCVLGHGMALWEPSCSVRAARYVIVLQGGIKMPGLLLVRMYLIPGMVQSGMVSSCCLTPLAWCGIVSYGMAVLYPMAWRYCILWHGGIVSYGTVTSVAACKDCQYDVIGSAVNTAV